MVTQCNRYDSAASARRTMAVIGIVVLLAAGLWLASPWCGVGSPQATNGGQALAAPPASLAATLVVTSSADSGPGTLRQALLDANSGVTITFDATVFPPGSPASINLMSSLPAIIHNNLTLDASNAGVILDGSGLSGGSSGLTIEKDGNVIRGLQILRFPGDGVSVAGGGNTIGGDRTVGSGPLGQGNLISGNGGAGVTIHGMYGMSNTVIGNFIGTDVSGAVALGNAICGVAITDEAQHNTIGDGTSGGRNVIAGNGGYGVWIGGWAPAHDNVVIGNYIGINAAGTAGISNTLYGVLIEGGAGYNHIGGSTPRERNVISGNGRQGVLIRGSDTMSNTVSGNYIGTDGSGTAAISNTENGVLIAGGPRYNHIGGSTPGERNVISGNGGSGVVIRDSETMGNTVTGNYIGTNASGTGSLPNAYEGVWVQAASNRVGGANPGEGNLISGNLEQGVMLFGNESRNNTILGNLIGTDVSGAVALGNRFNGVTIGNAAQNNTIGGGTSGGRNIISGNGDCGVGIWGSDTMSNTITGNYIGTNASGTAAISNAQNGVLIYGGSRYNRIGGSTPGERNVISGNGNRGAIILGSGTMSNTVTGNHIGTNAAGTAAISNAGDGMAIEEGAEHNRIGGSTPGERNIISGNGGHGVIIQGSGTMGNTVSGSYIGTNASGTASLPNALEGVLVGSASNHIGGANAGEGNLISGNGREGVQLSGSDSRNNAVLGNLIGTDVSGALALGNGDGVTIVNEAHGNTIGDGTSGGRNVIAGNGSRGVYIGAYKGGVPAHDNLVIGNYIGTNASGTAAVSSNQTGVAIGDGANHNRIGGSTAGERNIISGNGSGGVAIGGSGTISNTVSGNYIGTNASGTGSVSNAYQGVYVGSASNRIGGANPGEGNLISGNAGDGVVLYGYESENNAILGNLIGTDVSGAVALGNRFNGVGIVKDAHNNTIGDGTSGGRNVIGGNGGSGVYIGVYKGGGMLAHDNLVIGNYIGSNAFGTAGLGNGEGVAVDIGAQRNTIGPGNLIAYNLAVGVRISGTATLSNTITHNSIHTHNGLGIDNVNGGNRELLPPVISPLRASASVTGTACANCTVELFSDLQDEGRAYEGSAIADGSGHFSFNKPAGFAGPSLTATATDAGGNTSEFSSPVSVPHFLYLPLVLRSYRTR